MNQRRITALVLSIAVALLAAGLIAAATSPTILFTDNALSTGPTIGVTSMEQALLDQLNAAAVSIDAAIYDFDRASIRDALLAAHGRGVAVRVVTDDETYDDELDYYDELEAAGIPVVNDSRSSIMHNKFFVIDGAVVWTGSTNITDNGFTYNHNNSVVMTSTALAAIYTIEFEEMYVGRDFGTAKTDNTAHLVDYNGIPVEIYFSPTDDALDELIAEVNAATETIYFSIFFFTEDALRDAILAKAQQGVTVAGIWDLLGAANNYSDDETLCAAGVPIKIEDFGGKMHNKFMVVDANGTSPRVITGSMNWTGAGGDANDENTLIIHDTATAQQYLAAYDALWAALGDHTLCDPGTTAEFFVFLPHLVTPAGVSITTIFYDGVVGSAEPDEYVEIRNGSSAVVELAGWTLSDEAGSTFTFPSFLMQPGQVCRVYTNEVHAAWCGFSFGSGMAIWNNGGDCATLRDGGGAVVDRVCYP